MTAVERIALARADEQTSSIPRQDTDEQANDCPGSTFSMPRELSTSARIIGEIISAGGRAVSHAQLREMVGCSVDLIYQACKRGVQAGLIRKLSPGSYCAPSRIVEVAR
jgi:hypothetical protein